jgi:hypothetical protein
MKPLSSLTCYALTIRVRLAEPELHSLLAAATKVAQASQTGVYSCCTFRQKVEMHSMASDANTCSCQDPWQNQV